MNLQHIEIYTDGSCHTQQKNGAWASIILFAGVKTVLKGEEENTTHNRMELLSVIKTIEFIDEKQYEAKLIVYTRKEGKEGGQPPFEDAIKCCITIDNDICCYLLKRIIII